MFENPISQWVSLIISSLFGGTGIVSLILAKRERRATVSVTEANAVQEMQKAYAQMVIDNEEMKKELKEELRLVKEDLKKYIQQCKICPNNKIAS